MSVLRDRRGRKRTIGGSSSSVSKLESDVNVFVSQHSRSCFSPEQYFLFRKKILLYDERDWCARFLHPLSGDKRKVVELWVPAEPDYVDHSSGSRGHRFNAVDLVDGLYVLRCRDDNPQHEIRGLLRLRYHNIGGRWIKIGELVREEDVVYRVTDSGSVRPSAGHSWDAYYARQVAVYDAYADRCEAGLTREF